MPGGKRIFSTTNLEHQLIVGGVRSHRCRCYWSCKSRWPWLTNRFEIFASIHRFWRQLLPKRHSQFSLHMRRFEFTWSGCILATSHRHEWVSKNEILTKGKFLRVNNSKWPVKWSSDVQCAWLHAKCIYSFLDNRVSV